jgi:hypothetical protein
VERSVDQYNLDVVISVGYRVKSLRGTQFRIWATERLREFIVKGQACGVPVVGLVGGVRLTFEVAVEGPIVLGGPRHLGGGLFAAIA